MSSYLGCMMLSYTRYLSLLATVIAFSGAAAQTPAADPSAKLREVLPADVADRVIARIAAARALELPAAALENAAFKFAAKGVAAKEIETSVNEQADRMQKVREAIENGRPGKAAGAEIEAGAEAMRYGVDGENISQVARTAENRSLEVPFAVIGSLVNRGLPADEALGKVMAKLEARAPDSELQELSSSAKPAQTGTELADTKRPSTAGRPASVPGNAGKGAVPATPVPVPTKKP